LVDATGTEVDSLNMSLPAMCLLALSVVGLPLVVGHLVCELACSHPSQFRRRRMLLWLAGAVFLFLYSGVVVGLGGLAMLAIPSFAPGWVLAALVGPVLIASLAGVLILVSVPRTGSWHVRIGASARALGISGALRAALWLGVVVYALLAPYLAFPSVFGASSVGSLSISLVVLAFVSWLSVSVARAASARLRALVALTELRD